MKYKVYAKVNEDGNIIRFFSTCFEVPLDGDIFIKEGIGDEYVHVPQYDVYHENGSFKYKVIDNKVYNINPKEMDLVHRDNNLEERVKELENIIQILYSK